MSSTFERIKSVMVAELSHNAENITEDSNLLHDVGLDSLELVELEMALEEEFEVEVPLEASSDWVTMADVIETVKAALAASTLRLGEAV